jgi:S1-C subfamily serine protease
MSEGIVSSFRSLGKNPQVYIQITAAVNPGNSGGPIIDESGYVRGVTTLSMLDMQGVSFAIPIEKVYEEFGSLLH